MAKAANAAPKGTKNKANKTAEKAQLVAARGTSQTSRQSLAGVGAQAQFPGKYGKAKTKGKTK